MSEMLAPIGHPEWKPSVVFLNHPQMLHVFMGWEVQVARQELHDDAANRPHIAGVTPLTAAQNHLRGPILPCVHDLAVVLRFLCCSTKVNNSDGVAARQLFINVLAIEFPTCSVHLPFLK